MKEYINHYNKLNKVSRDETDNLRDTDRNRSEFAQNSIQEDIYQNEPKNTQNENSKKLN